MPAHVRDGCEASAKWQIMSPDIKSPAQEKYTRCLGKINSIYTIYVRA